MHSNAHETLHREGSMRLANYLKLEARTGSDRSLLLELPWGQEILIQKSLIVMDAPQDTAHT